MDIHLKVLIACILSASFLAKADVIPLLYDTITKKIVAPTNLLGFTMAGQVLTNLVGNGLTNDNGTLKASGGAGLGTVTSVGLALPSQLSISGSPVTGSGTLTGAWVNQVANRIFAGPTTGADTIPTFRALVDDDIPNTITIDLATTATTANSGDSATAFFSSGEIEDVRLPAGLARDAEVAASYQPLDTDLTRLAGIGTGTQGDLIYRDANGWTNLARGSNGQFLAATSTGLAYSNAPSGGGGLSDGGTAASLTVTNLTTTSLTLGGLTKTNWPVEGYAFYDEQTEFSTADSLGTGFAGLPWVGFAFSSGTAQRQTGQSGRYGIQRINSSTSANSGFIYMLNSTEGMLLTNTLWSEMVFRIISTNACVSYIGFNDHVSAAAPVDALSFTLGRDRTPATWNLVEGIARNNNSETVTSNGFYLTLNNWYRGTIEIDTAGTTATFTLWDANSNSFPGTGLWTNTVTGANLTLTRQLGHSMSAWTTNATSATALIELDYARVRLPTVKSKTVFR